MRAIRYLLAVPLFAFILSGCVVRTYPLTRARVDQNLEGNRGFTKGQGASQGKERKTTRTTQVFEIELHSPLKFEKAPACKVSTGDEAKAAEDKEAWGNRGYTTQSESPAILENSAAGFQNYTVQKDDTLQKISQKFYATTKKWTKIFDANKDILKGPSKIYPGQVIKIPNLPAEKVEEPKEKIK